MPYVRFTSADGSGIDVDGDVGQSVMELAKRGGIAAILGECGGSCACATCHVVVAEEWRARVNPASRDEADMLEFVVEQLPGSRLACQIRLTTDLDGLSVAVPHGGNL